MHDLPPRSLLKRKPGMCMPSRHTTLAILSLLLGAGDAWAYRDGGCVRIMPAPRPPSVFGGVGLPAGDAAQAVAIARKLGLGTVACRDRNGWWMEGVQLGPTALSWRMGGFGDRLLGLPTIGVTPLLHDQGDWGCPWHRPMLAEQPAGARQVIRAIAVVNDLDVACDAGLYPGDWPGTHLSFGRPFDIPWLGARAREVQLQNGALRLIEPVDPHGPAARWLADGGPRWLGLTFEVDDLSRVAEVLQRRGVVFLRGTDRRRPVMLVEPAEVGGTLVEFVEGTPS